MQSRGFSSLNQQKPPFLRALPAYILNLVIVLLSVKTLDFVSVDNVHVILFLTPLFYWTIHNPFILPLWFLFLAGLFIDFLTDGLLGLHAFSFLIYYLALYRSRRIILSQPILYQFCIFILTAFCFEVLRWLLLSLLLWQGLSIIPSITAAVVNIICFPIIILVLKACHRLTSDHGRSF
jgi:rod shape-determining protein MreD